MDYKTKYLLLKNIGNQIGCGNTQPVKKLYHGSPHLL